MKPNSKFACEICKDEGEYEVISGHVDHVDSRGGYHGSDQLSYNRHCSECPRCGECGRVIGHFDSLAGSHDEWGFFHPHGDESEKLHWCSSRCMIEVMMTNYKRITEEL